MNVISSLGPLWVLFLLSVSAVGVIEWTKGMVAAAGKKSDGGILPSILSLVSAVVIGFTSSIQPTGLSLADAFTLTWLVLGTQELVGYQILVQGFLGVFRRLLAPPADPGTGPK